MNTRSGKASGDDVLSTRRCVYEIVPAEEKDTLGNAVPPSLVQGQAVRLLIELPQGNLYVSIESFGLVQLPNDILRPREVHAVPFPGQTVLQDTRPPDDFGPFIVNPLLGALPTPGSLPVNLAGLPKALHGVLDTFPDHVLSRSR